VRVSERTCGARSGFYFLIVGRVSLLVFADILIVHQRPKNSPHLNRSRLVLWVL